MPEDISGDFNSQLMKCAFMSMLENGYRGVCIIDKDANVIYVNKWYEEFYSIPNEVIVGKNIADFFPQSKLQRTLKEGIIYRDEVDRRFHVPILVTRLPIADHGEIVGAMSLFRMADDIAISAANMREQMVKEDFRAKYTLDDIVTQSPQIQRLKEIAAVYAKSNASVLIAGQSGVGKELFAQGIHNASFRKRMPFVAINCAALPESLLESELFGYAEATFTGAKKGGKAGLFQLAHRGTLFLDEIGEMPISLQSKLLRVLQEKVVRPVGGEKQIPVDVRIIAATNKSFPEEIENGHFRKDLFYRLSTLELNIPPLDDRREDISLLTYLFLEKCGINRNFPLYTPMISILMDILHDWHFDGNVRELQNIIERFSLMVRANKLQGNREDILHFLKIGQVQREVSISLSNAEAESNLSAVNDEKQLLQQLLKKYGGNKKKVAEEMGYSVPTLYRHIKQAGLSSNGGIAIAKREKK